MSDLKHVVDVGAVASLVGVLMGYLPQVATLLTVIWMALRVYNEAATLLERHQAKRHQRLRRAAARPGSD